MYHKQHKLNRYHADVYFPVDYESMILEFINTFNEIDLTSHAAEQMYQDKRGYIPLPSLHELLHYDNKLIEIYERKYERGCIQKIVIRITSLSENYDYSYVVARGGTVVTCWANDKNDQHRLSESNNEYISGENDERLLT